MRSVGELQLEDHRLLAGRRRKLPTDHRVPPKLRYDHGLTALMAAALGSHSRVVAALQELGADPDARNMQRETALMMAVVWGSPQCAKIVLEAGADVHIRADVDDTDFTSYDGMTALEIAYAEIEKYGMRPRQRQVMLMIEERVRQTGGPR